MRARQVRLFSMSDVARIDRDFQPVSASALALAALPPEERSGLRLAALADTTLTKPAELTWRDWAVFLLHTAAEIEHALLVQYLYAAYSLADGGFLGAAVPSDGGDLTKRWRQTITRIAKEEMAHLLTVQNLLRFIGGPLNFDREDFPFLAFLYPFRFNLEPLTKTSLAKYVAAEMPAEPAQPPELIQEIVQRAAEAGGGQPVNRVGALYATLTNVFDTKLADSDLRSDTVRSQASGDDWHAPMASSLIVRAVGSRQDAVKALQAIGAQGEGWANPPAGAPQPSHFDLFLGIYTAFPEPAAPGGPATWVPARSVPTNPNTLHLPSDVVDVERGRITHPATRLWANLFNVRYRMLLADLAHALHLSGEDQSAVTIRGHLRDWAFTEMRLGIKAIAQTLTTLPLKETPDPADPAQAGPPFEMPYTLALPDDERDRWRLHLALLDTSSELISKIEAASGPSSLLTQVKQNDLQARDVAEASAAVGTSTSGRQRRTGDPEGDVPMNRFERVIQILDDAIGGPDASIGAHGAFWRELTRDQFVAKKVFGLDLIVVGQGASSNLVKALKGESPFGADLPDPPPDANFPRMPAGLDPVSEEDIAFIERWIDEGCPEDPLLSRGTAPGEQASVEPGG
jgi:Ferritin-like